MHRIGFVVFPRFQLMGFAAVTAFEMANLALGETVYEIELLSEAGGEVKSSAGFGVLTKTFDHTAYDTVMFGAGVQIEPMTPGLVEFARRSFETARRVAAPCTGAFVLPNPDYWTDVGRRRIGPLRASCRIASRPLKSRRTGSSSSTEACGHRPE